VVLAALLRKLEVGFPGLLPLLLHANRSDHERLVLEGIKAELLLAVMGFDFPDVRGYLFVEVARNDEAWIFLKELDAHRHRLGAGIVKGFQPFRNRFGAIRPFVEFDCSEFFQSWVNIFVNPILSSSSSPIRSILLIRKFCRLSPSNLDAHFLGTRL
jgi:hypothetical protein